MVWIGLVVPGGCTTILGVDGDYRLDAGRACIPVDDKNPCTDDVCDNGVPMNKPTAAGSPCWTAATHCDGWGACVAPACTGTLGFSFGAFVSTGLGPVFVVTADLNGDGKPDLVTANQESNNVSVLLNNGSGTFAAKVDYSAGSAPIAITAADLNGDGKPDLAVVNTSSETLNVFINNGDGTFKIKVDYPLGSSPDSVAAADFNGDGKPDLAVANAGHGNVSVLTNNGDGTFAAKVDYSTGSSPRSIVTSDLNGDHKPDIAITNSDFQGRTVSVLLNNGDGTFKAEIRYDGGFELQSITVADLDGDGDPDFAVASSTGDSSPVGILLNNGDGTFAAKITYPAGPTDGLVAADLNGDGKPDLITSGIVLNVLFNNGNGTFPAPVGYVVNGAYRVAASDLNSDGRPDLAGINGDGVRVLLTTCMP